MINQHTPEKLFFEESDWTIRAKAFGHSDLMADYRGNIIADLKESVGNGPEERGRDHAVPEMKANARRIVACWNACRGTSNEHLADDGVIKMREDRDQLLRSNEVLTAILAEAVAALKNFENDDASVPESIWAMRNEVIEKCAALGID